MRSRLTRMLVQIAAVVFLLNTTVAYGACCLPNAGGESAEQSEGLPPCHQTSSQSQSDDETGERTGVGCCLACLPLLEAQALQTIDLTQQESFALSANVPFWASEINQLFRPPIHA